MTGIKAFLEMGAEVVNTKNSFWGLSVLWSVHRVNKVGDVAISSSLNVRCYKSEVAGKKLLWDCVLKMLSCLWCLRLYPEFFHLNTEWAGWCLSLRMLCAFPEQHRVYSVSMEGRSARMILSAVLSNRWRALLAARVVFPNHSVNSMMSPKWPCTIKRANYCRYSLHKI